MNRKHYKTSIGTICVEENENYITAIFLDEEYNLKEEKESKLIKKTYEEILEYLEGKRRIFDIPVKPQGTEFQKMVWKELCNIPYGTTCTYKQTAEKIGNPNACRAVGGANHNNPIMILIPCHRVIGKNGDLVGYAGGVDVKKKLLELEKNEI